ncbi:MAG: gamma-glutamyltransferase [Woeseiaceae bacterium]|nr:gamma-glutamyltransferase [Woeseiaceae bacterium]
MPGVAVATTSQLAAEAAREIAELGGNAVDCGLAAALFTINTEPGVCALCGGGFVTVWPAGGEPVTIDGNVAVPGHGLPESRRGAAADAVELDYGGGISTMVGSGTVAVPGTLAAIELAWRRFGSVSWEAIFAPTVRAAREGFPLSAACNYYLGYAGKTIYGRSSDGYGALHDGDALKPTGSRIVVPHLADSLELIAREGARAFYEGDLAKAIDKHVQDAGGLLNAEDLKRYEAVERSALMTELGSWRIATNPPPAVGGVMLTAMLRAFSAESFSGWDTETVGRLIEVQRSCLDYRRKHLDYSDDVSADAAEFLDAVAEGRLHKPSAATVHTSTVDSDGLGCALTASSGYGSGEMPEGTGLWLNNCVGELELNRRGFEAGPVGARLPSNMAPSVARNDDRVLAVGSPGADRITTALQQFLINALMAEMSLEDAVRHPRIHVDTSGAEPKLAAEAGIPLPETDLPVREFGALNMYFGGVGVAGHSEELGFAVAADPRRAGGTIVLDG